MNKKLQKYSGDLYEFREITDLKQMMNSSEKLYGDKTGYLVKDRPGGSYLPVSYHQLKEDVDGLGTALIELGLKGKKSPSSAITATAGWLLTWPPSAAPAFPFLWIRNCR